MRRGAGRCRPAVDSTEVKTHARGMEAQTSRPHPMALWSAEGRPGRRRSTTAAQGLRIDQRDVARIVIMHCDIAAGPVDLLGRCIGNFRVVGSGGCAGAAEQCRRAATGNYKRSKHGNPFSSTFAQYFIRGPRAAPHASRAKSSVRLHTKLLASCLPRIREVLDRLSRRCLLQQP